MKKTWIILLFCVLSLLSVLCLGDQNDMPSDCYLSELYSQLTQLSNSNPDRFNEEDLGEFFKILTLLISNFCS